jgi:hypothetical protein
MTITDDYSFGTTAQMIEALSDEDAKQMFESLESERWIEETKNIF